MTEEKQSRETQEAYVGGGCFWCIEAVFNEIQGVGKIQVGYAGGGIENPTYQQVCTGDTQHAEVVRITFDPSIIGYRELLTIFFHSHDPTTMNEQGPDKGTQYRSIILTIDDEQKAIAEEVIEELQDQGLWDGKPFVTEIVPLEAFYVGEESHHDYYRRNPDKKYCQMIISPKVLKMRKLFADRYKEQQGEI